MSARRAPRLRPDEHLAPHITRRGRFRRIDPLTPRKLPSVGRIVAAGAWGLLLEESLRRAYRAVWGPREEQEAVDG